MMLSRRIVGYVQKKEAKMQEIINEFVKNTLAQREEILAAFVAKHGWQPDEIVQVIQSTPDGVKYFVRIMSPDEKNARVFFTNQRAEIIAKLQETINNGAGSYLSLKGRLKDFIGNLEAQHG